MQIEIYCDENNQNLFTSKNPTLNFATIGSIWIEAEKRQEIKEKIKSLRKKHRFLREIKWNKVSFKKMDFYKEIIDLFFSYGNEMRFRSIIIPAKDIKWEILNNDHELGFYKFYYQMLHHWIFENNKYNIFCDIKTNRNKKEYSVFKECLQKANVLSEIKNIQALPSKEVELIQLADLLLGAVSARLNESLKSGGAKEKFVLYLEKKLSSRIQPTSKSEPKFNVFQIQLNGGDW